MIFSYFKNDMLSFDVKLKHLVDLFVMASLQSHSHERSLFKDL